jgi:hypothetical protein
MSSRLGGFIAGQNINVSIGTFTTGASPDLTFGSVAGTPAVGQAVQFTTTGTLPAGFSLNTTYYVRSVSSNTCQVSTTQGGSATAYTTAGTGTHTAVTQRAFNPYAGAPDTVEYLVVAGGGGAAGGGGGAGGLLTAANYAVASGSALTVTVGAGGAGGSNPSTAAANGSNSVFSGITATGGGRGGIIGVAGNSGGSGGGAGQDINTGAGAGTSGQGNAGGNANRNSYGGAGGGGGAGSAGTVPFTVDSTKSSGGNGGAGVCSTITGQRVFYAGGGGGGINVVGAYSGVIPGGLGTAGGGDGTSTNSGSGTSATSNSGSGGGGCEADGGTGGNGGSGIVIVRYPQLNSAPALVTGSPQVSYSNGYQIYTWTSSGSIIF